MAKGVGVYIGTNEIIAVSVIHTVQGPQVKEYAVEPIHPEESEPSLGKEAHKLKQMTPEARAISKALTKIKEPGAYVTAAVSPVHVVTRHFIMPAVPKKELDEAVRFEASRYIPFKLSESVMDYSEQSTHKNVLSVMVTAMKKEILYQCLNDLRAASAKVLMVEAFYSAVGRFFASLNMFQKVKTCGFITIQSDGNVNLTFASKGVVYLSRDFLFTGKLEEDKDRFHGELKASLDYFYKLTGGEAIQQVFVSGYGELKFWVEYLEQTFNYSIRFDLANFPNGKTVPPEIMNSIGIAYGLALRSLGHQSPLGEISLLPFEERRMKPELFWGILGGGAGAAFLFFLLVRLIIFQPYIMNLENQYDRILGPASGVDSKVAESSRESLEIQNGSLAAKTAFLNGFYKARIAPSEIFTVLAEGLPESAWIDYVSFENALRKGASSPKGKKRMNLRGGCYLENAEREAATINEWTQSLIGKPGFKNVFSEIKLEEVKREQVSGFEVTRFRIVAE
ncbi:MAG: Competence protein A [Candidatus Omnitrophica bacterium ADurb.Bin277]|nr:MAG: Competence protein A [Candidatus Omnitrophica bacterium ADurb.Bin277]